IARVDSPLLQSITMLLKPQGPLRLQMGYLLGLDVDQRIPQGGRIKGVDLHKPSGLEDDVALEGISGRISDGVFDTPQFFPPLWGEPGQFRNEVPARDPSNIIFSILGLDRKSVV